MALSSERKEENLSPSPLPVPQHQRRLTIIDPKDDLPYKKASFSSEDGATSEELDDSFSDLVVPPDGGWGWVIVFASFMSNVIVDGIIFSFGIFLMEFATSFNETKAKTAWVGSLLAGCYLLIGPVVSAFTNSFGSRRVSIAGSIIACCGFLMSFFANSISVLMFTFGVVGGIGFGFVYLPATTLACFYFDRKRALAMGIAVCGSGIGTFSVAPLIQYLNETYGWRGAVLIIAGMVLNCAVFGSLYRPLEPPTPTPKITIEEEKEDDPDRKPLLMRIKEAREAMMVWDSTSEMADSSTAVVDKLSSLPPPAMKTARAKSLQIPPTYHVVRDIRNSGSESEGSPPPPYSEVQKANGEGFGYVNLADKSIYNRQQRSMSACYFPNSAKLRARRQSRIRQDASRPFYRQDILFSSSLTRLPEFRSQPDLAHYHRSVTRIPNHERCQSADPLNKDDDDDSEEGESGWCSDAMKDTFRQMLDLSLLKSVTFMVLCVAGFLTLAGFFVPFIYIIDLASLAGHTREEGTFILSVIGITNTVGRVFSGWISDRPNINALVINNIALTAGGLATATMPLVVNCYGLLLACAAIFGFSIACFAALRSIILVQMHGLERLSNTIGLLLLFQGLASIIGAPVAGLFFDSTGSYHFSFYIAGAMIALSGIMCFPLPSISRWEKNRTAQKQKINLPPELLVEDQKV